MLGKVQLMKKRMASPEPKHTSSSTNETFKPAISKMSQKLMKGREGKIEDRLVEEGNKQKQKMIMREKEEKSRVVGK